MVSLPSGIKGHKLTMSFLLMIVLFFSFGAFTIRGLVTLGNLTRTIHDHPLVVSNASLNAALNMTKMHRSMKDVVLANDVSEIEMSLSFVAESEQKVYRQLNTIRRNTLGEEGQVLEKQIRQLFLDWAPIREEVVRLLRAGNREQAIRATREEGADHVEKLEAKMLELTSYSRRKATTFLRLAERSQSNLEKSTVVLTLAGVIIAALIAFSATCRVIESERVLRDEKDKVQQALDEIKILRGIIPICSHCKQIRDDAGMWKRIEEYIDAHSEASFSHGICPDCMEKHYPEFAPGFFEEKEGEEETVG